MGDLNPSLKNNKYKKYFDAMLKRQTKPYYKDGTKQGDKYFYIPALKRTRGVKHFYLESFCTGEYEKDLKYTKKVAKNIIKTYVKILNLALKEHKTFSKKDAKKQLDYHTLYFLQVLTLDRGTTSGLLIHNQNDIGIMGSIPSHVNKALLKTWVNKMPKPQDKLLKNLISCLDNCDKKLIAKVDKKTKQKLANVVREHYKNFPQALSLQANGGIIPPTVDNHK